MAVKLASRTGRALLPEKLLFLSLVLFFVRGFVIPKAWLGRSD
jgi:hypothetical protein